MCSPSLNNGRYIKNTQAIGRLPDKPTITAARENDIRFQTVDIRVCVPIPYTYKTLIRPYRNSGV